MKELQIFNFKGNKVREITDKNNNPWFIARDICGILEIKNVPDAIASLDDDEKLVSVLPIAGQNRSVNLINESGLYSLILRSRKPEAKVFKKWVTSEVLPSIRQNGGYLSQSVDFADPDNIQKLLDNWKADRQKIKEMTPKYLLAETALRDEKQHYSIRDAGKHLGLRQKDIFAILRSNGLLTLKNTPSQRAIDYGVLQLRTNSDANGKNHPQSIMTMQNILNFKERYVKGEAV